MPPDPPLRVEVRLDPGATPGQLVSALAALVLARARQALQPRPETTRAATGQGVRRRGPAAGG
jgi:hypothetical protein